MSRLTKFLGSKLSGYIALGAAAVIIVMGLIIWGMAARIDIAKAQRDQYKTESEACQKNFKTNKKVSDAYFEQNLDLRSLLAADKRLLKDQCTSIPTTARADDPAPEGYVWKGQVSVADSLDYYAECGELENRLRSLQAWIEETRNPPLK